MQIYYCKYCGSPKIYQAFKILACFDCSNAWSIDNHPIMPNTSLNAIQDGSQCRPTLTECKRCGNDIKKCDGSFMLCQK